MQRMLAVLVAFLVAVTLAGHLVLHAQPQIQPERPIVFPPRIVSGNDLGFRVDGTDPRTGNPTGTWLIRLDGRWVEIGSMPRFKPAK
jgi:hypothetical protein